MSNSNVYGSSINSTVLFREMRRGMRKFLPRYKKVVFRAYSDKDFLLPLDRGEPQEHLGIMGPFIRAEINDFLTVSIIVTQQNKRTLNHFVPSLSFVAW